MNADTATTTRQHTAELMAGEDGQAVTEYALLAFWTVIVAFASIQALEMALFDFFQDVASLICLPIP